jgi:hypothetical protein
LKKIIQIRAIGIESGKINSKRVRTEDLKVNSKLTM